MLTELDKKYFSLAFACQRLRSVFTKVSSFDLLVTWKDKFHLFATNAENFPSIIASPSGPS